MDGNKRLYIMFTVHIHSIYMEYEFTHYNNKN